MAIKARGPLNRPDRTYVAMMSGMIGSSGADSGDLDMLINPRKASESDDGYDPGPDLGTPLLGGGGGSPTSLSLGASMMGLGVGDDGSEGSEPSDDGSDEDGGSIAGDGGSFRFNPQHTHPAAPPPSPPQASPPGGAPARNFVADDSSYFAPRPPTKEEVISRKSEILTKLDRMERNGAKLPFRHSMSSDLAVMEADYNRLVTNSQVDGTVKTGRQSLMMLSNGLEWLNRMYNPFNIKLDGWSDTMFENLDDYNESLEELHFKYRGKSKLPPEARILLTFVSSAFYFHISQTLFSSMPPDVSSIMRNNPDLMKQFAAAAAKDAGRNAPGAVGQFADAVGDHMSQAKTPRATPPARAAAPARALSRIDELLNYVESPPNSPPPPRASAPSNTPAPVPGPAQQAAAAPRAPAIGGRSSDPVKSVLEILSPATSDDGKSATSSVRRRRNVLRI